MRTIKNLSKLNGRVYIYLANAEIGHRFMQQAESEGFTFKDGEKPTERGFLKNICPAITTIVTANITERDLTARRGCYVKP